jgi:hypothetical protein
MNILSHKLFHVGMAYTYFEIKFYPYFLPTNMLCAAKIVPLSYIQKNKIYCYIFYESFLMCYLSN